jgi:hypothetical protein
MSEVTARAAGFLRTHARLLERRLFAHQFEQEGAEAVVEALRAYRNEDGGFGQALEPDIRAPQSQPICVELALKDLGDCGTRDEELIAGACDFLEGLGGPAVSPALPSALEYPHAGHWEIVEWSLEPGLNPTAGIAGQLHALGFEHPWRERATEWCLDRLQGETIKSAHTIRSVLTLLGNLPDQKAEFDRIAAQLNSAEWFQMEVPVKSYTMTPLHFQEVEFENAIIEAHLNDLVSNQQEDGGWPIHWKAPGETAVREWRGRWTLDALRALLRHGRI